MALGEVLGAGFDAVVDRGFLLTSPSFDAQDGSSTPYGDTGERFERFCTWLTRQGAESAEESSVFFLATIWNLLANLIGETLVSKLLTTTWPEAG